MATIQRIISTSVVYFTFSLWMSVLATSFAHAQDDNPFEPVLTIIKIQIGENQTAQAGSVFKAEDVNLIPAGSKTVPVKLSVKYEAPSLEKILTDLIARAEALGENPELFIVQTLNSADFLNLRQSIRAQVIAKLRVGQTSNSDLPLTAYSTSVTFVSYEWVPQRNSYLIATIETSVSLHGPHIYPLEDPNAYYTTDVWLEYNDAQGAPLTSNNISVIFNAPVPSNPIWLLPLLGGIVLSGVFFRKNILSFFSKTTIEPSTPNSLSELDEQSQDDNPVANLNTLEPLEVPENLAQIVHNRQAVLVLGSDGLIPFGFPDKATLLKQLVDKLQSALPPDQHKRILAILENFRDDIDEEQFSLVIETLLTSTSRQAVINGLYKIIAPSTVQPAFLKTLRKIDWAGSMLFTWDERSDNILRGQRGLMDGKIRDVSLHEGDVLRELVNHKEMFHIRAVGRLDDPKTVSLTVEEFRNNIDKSPELKRQLATLLQTRSFVFFGLSPTTIKTIFEVFGVTRTTSRLQHFAVVPWAPENDLYAAPLNRYDVKLLEYHKNDGLNAVTSFFKTLSNPEKSSVTDAQSSISYEKAASSYRVTELELENIGPFEKLLVNFNAGAEDNNCPWTVLMGPNGSGKSVILRSMALALTGTSDHIAKNTHSLLKSGTDYGSIKLAIGDQQYLVEFKRDVSHPDGIKVTSKYVSVVEAHHTLVLGFPALRGAPSPDPINSSDMRGGPPVTRDLYPLVLGDIDDRMRDFKQWILNVLLHSKNPREKQIRTLLDEIITDMVPGGYDGFADIQPDNIIRLLKTSKENISTEVQFSSMSQGMAAIFNWVGVLIQRLYDVYPEEASSLLSSKKGIKPSDREAIVIIDEVDVHLHPDWQRRLVELTRKHFPKVQFIASSHSALLAGALRAHEIRTIRQSPDGFLVQQPSVDVYGMSVSRILTSEVVGLPTERPPVIEEKIKEYLELFEKIEPLNNDEKQKLDRLGAELESFGWLNRKRNLKPPSPHDIQTLLDTYSASTVNPSKGEASDKD